jgi:hypothetical protein
MTSITLPSPNNAWGVATFNALGQTQVYTGPGKLTPPADGECLRCRIAGAVLSAWASERRGADHRHRRVRRLSITPPSSREVNLNVQGKTLSAIKYTRLKLSCRSQARHDIGTHWTQLKIEVS